MIERVAEAIRLAGEGCQSGAVYVDPQAAARAAIEAMREPTIEMRVAYDQAHRRAFTKSGFAIKAYRAMIDAAIKEQP